MRALIVCRSVHHNNTQKIAEAIAEEINAKVVEPENISEDALQDYELIGFGSGIYYLKHHKALFDFIDKISPIKKCCFIFSTKGFTPTLINHSSIKRRLKKKGFTIVGEFSCKGYDTVGPLRLFGGINKNRPNDNDLRRAKEFARSLEKKCERF